VPTAAQFLAQALTELGYTETPVNRTKFAAEAGHLDGGAWCATFEVALGRRAGLDLPPGVAETAYTWTALDCWERAKRSPAEPQPGDWVYFRFGQGHTGICESVTADAITTIDGNTVADGLTGDEANGGMVARKTRSRTLVAGLGRPDYHPALQGAPGMVNVLVPSWSRRDPTTSRAGFYVLADDLASVQAFNGAPLNVLPAKLFAGFLPFVELPRLAGTPIGLAEIQSTGAVVVLCNDGGVIDVARRP
jgi:hypothetical protein